MGQPNVLDLVNEYGDEVEKMMDDKNYKPSEEAKMLYNIIDEIFTSGKHITKEELEKQLDKFNT